MSRRVDYDERQHAVYSAGRGITPPVARTWTAVLRRYLDRAMGAEILDLGSGIGTYSCLLADEFDATVTGVEPSVRMREVAEREYAHPRVRYVEGAAEAIPSADESFDAAFMSHVLHHVQDRGACVAELRRVLRPGGLVLVRGALRESLPHIAFLEFFPSARAIDEERMPAAGDVVALFARADFEHIATEQVDQESAASMRAYCERISKRAISTLELIDDAEFDQGIARMRQAAERESTPQPVRERIGLVALRRP